MADRYRIFGSELSPYSVKVRSYFRYKGIPHEWVVRGPSNQAEYQRHAKLPLIPLVVAPDGGALQDSTPILEAMERAFPEPSIHPAEPLSAFVSALLEEYADEWGNKWMFHYRWWYEPDQWSCAERIARDQAPAGASAEQIRGLATAVRERMVPRIGFVGSSERTRPTIERSFERVLALLETHLARRAFADFGLAPQLYESLTDPTPGARIRAVAPHVQGWIERMLDPKGSGAFEPWGALEPTLAPLLRDEVGALFLPWSTANARAIEAGAETMEVDLAGRRWDQKPQKYHARSLAALRARYAAVADRGALDRVLEAAGCRRWLA